jgi:hypothetical protein
MGGLSYQPQAPTTSRESTWAGETSVFGDPWSHLLYELKVVLILDTQILHKSTPAQHRPWQQGRSHHSHEPLQLPAASGYWEVSRLTPTGTKLHRSQSKIKLKHLWSGLASYTWARL